MLGTQNQRRELSLLPQDTQHTTEESGFKPRSSTFGCKNRPYSPSTTFTYHFLWDGSHPVLEKQQLRPEVTQQSTAEAVLFTTLLPFSLGTGNAPRVKGHECLENSRGTFNLQPHLVSKETEARWRAQAVRLQSPPEYTLSHPH